MAALTALVEGVMQHAPPAPFYSFSEGTAAVLHEFTTGRTRSLESAALAQTAVDALNRRHYACPLTLKKS